jgi:uncharacterized protein YecE (DUF72 family)
MEVMQKIKNNPALVFVGGLLIVSMFVGYRLNENTAKQSEIKYFELQRKSDSTTKALADELNITIEQNRLLKDELKQAKQDSVELHSQIKSLRKVIKVYVQIKNNSDSVALRNLTRLLTDLEDRQRKRKEGK